MTTNKFVNCAGAAVVATTTKKRDLVQSRQQPSMWFILVSTKDISTVKSTKDSISTVKSYITLSKQATNQQT